MDEPASFSIARPRRRVWPMVLAVAVIAFLLGLAAMVVVMRTYAGWFGIAPSAAVNASGSGAGSGAEPGTATPAYAPRSPLSASGSASDLETLSTREAALTGRIGELEARLGGIGAAAQTASGNANRAEGLLVAFAARRALDRGLGLGYLEGQLRDRFGPVQPQAVATVFAAARQPVTLEDLREGIEAIAPQLATGNTTDGWWASLRREISDLVVIRRDTAPSPRPSDRLIRARRMLDGGQVEGALAEVARLPGAEAGDRWIAAAKRYIDARRALDTVETAAIMGQGRDPAAPAPAPSVQPAPAVAPLAGDPVTRAAGQ